MQINEKIRMMREMYHWSQEDMAERINMSVNGYAKIERGETKLYLDKLNQIAQVFDIDVIELMAVNDKGLICLISENSQHSSNYYGSSEQLTNEVEKLHLIICHKDELLAQQKQEIDALKEIITLLKQQTTA